MIADEDLPPAFLRKLAGWERRPVTHWIWKGILAIGRNNISGLASQLAYSFLFALFPFVISLVALASWMPQHGLIDKLLFEVSPFVPSIGFNLISKNVHDILSHRHVGLVSLGFIVGLWTNSGAIYTLLSGLNQVYGVIDRRSVLTTRGLCLGLTLAVDALAVITLLLVIWGGSAGLFLSNALGRPELYSTAWSVVRWPAAVAVLFGVVIGLYWILPNVHLRLRDVFWGALVAVGLWVPTTIGFSAYLSKFPNYGAAYGSIGAVIILLTWLWLNGLMLMLGGQINALIAGARGLQPRKGPLISSR